MRQRDRESITGSDPQDLFFGPSEDDPLLGDTPYGDRSQGDAPYGETPYGDGAPDDLGRYDDGPDLDALDLDGVVVTRAARRHGSRHTRKRNRRLFGIVGVLLVLVIAVAAYLVALPIYHYLHPADYSGSGTGTAIVAVHADDGAKQIGDTLHKDGVVASSRAFTEAASANAKSQDIQPGSYRLRKHMSASSALGLLLTPSSRLNSDVVVPEGATIIDIEKRLTAPPCTESSPQGTVCGLGLSKDVVSKALANVKALGLPTDYTIGNRAPASVEGFLYPATYALDDKTTVTDALQQMVGKFTDQAKSTNFTARADANNITPYQQLIIASIAQGEAKYSQDMPKVARVILNRLSAHRNLQIDATSAYAAKLRGIDPLKTIFSEAAGPFNTYNHPGLPPTPIGNPGVDAMNAAAHPAAGNWLFYVNGDKAGHLVFTNNEKVFAVEKHRCAVNGWGCSDS